MDLGVLLTQKKQYEEAVATLRKAVELDPTQPDAHYRLGHVYQAMGKSTQAEEEFKKVQQLHEKSDINLTPKMSAAPPSIQQ